MQKNVNIFMNLHIAYICGILSVKGSVSFGNVKGNYRIYLETVDSKLAKRFAEKLFVAFNKKPKIVKGKRYFVILYGKKYVENLSNYISTETYTPKLHEEEFIDNFLRGMFDFSSNVRLKVRTHKDGRKQLIPQVRINTKRLQLLKFVKDELKRRGINSSVCKTGSTFTLEISGKSNILMFLQKIGSKDERKVERLRYYLGWYEKSRSPVVEIKE